MHLTIDAGRCEGHGRCYDLVPDVVQPDDEGHATLVNESGAVPPGYEGRVETAARNCPERALAVDP
jgi:ferredoxin